MTLRTASRMRLLTGNRGSGHDEPRERGRKACVREHDERCLNGRVAQRIGGSTGALFLAVVLALFFLSSSMAAARSCRGASVVQKASRSFIAAARSRSEVAFERALRRHLAITRIALFALGRDARRLSAKDRRRYVNLAARYIARQLAARSGAFRNARVEISRCRGNLIEGRVLPRGDVIRWRIKGNRIIDVNMSGIWLAMALRDHFRSLIRRTGGDVQAFLASLK